MSTVVTQNRKKWNGRANDFSGSCLWIFSLLWKTRKESNIYTLFIVENVELISTTLSPVFYYQFDQQLGFAFFVFITMSYNVFLRTVTYFRVYSTYLTASVFLDSSFYGI